VKTPPVQRAAGRKKLAAKKQALPDGSFPVPNVDYLKKAIRSVGRAPASKRPALKALIRKRARELKATNAKGVKGTWAMQNTSDGEQLALDLAGTTPVASSMDGPRITTMGGSKPSPVAATIYKKLVRRGMKPAQAKALAKRAAAKHARAKAA